MAVPFAVAKATVTVELLAAESVTVKEATAVPLLPSATLTSLIDRVGKGCGVVVRDRALALAVREGCARAGSRG